MASFFREISSIVIFDLIPLDLLLHCIVGLIITIYSLLKGMTHTQIFIILVTVAGLKEFNDYFFHQYAGWEEYATDFGITFFYFGMSLLVRKIKQSMLSRSESKRVNIRI